METVLIRYRSLSLPARLCVLFLLVGVASLVGWAAETLGFLLFAHGWYDRGFLTLPFCPLYGFSCLIMYALFRTPLSGFWRKGLQRVSSRGAKCLVMMANLLGYAAVTGVLASSVELLTGLFYDRVYGLRLWDYSHHPDNLGGYVTLRTTLLWGVASAGGMTLIWHPLQLAFSRLPVPVLTALALTLAAALATDFLCNMVYLSGTGRHFRPLPHLFQRPRFAPF